MDNDSRNPDQDVEVLPPPAVPVEANNFTTILANLTTPPPVSQRDEDTTEVNRYERARCFQEIFKKGSSTFSLVYVKDSFFSKSLPVFHTDHLGTTPIRVKILDSFPTRMAMTLRTLEEPEFLTYISSPDETRIDIFCPELEEPIGHILVRNRLPYETEIICRIPTEKKFILKEHSGGSEAPPTVEIIDANGRLMGAANVIMWSRRTRGLATSINWEKFQLHLTRLMASDPARVALVVGFVVWTKHAKGDIATPKGTRAAFGAVFSFIGMVIAMVIILIRLNSNS